jgi:hypothetical protein
MTEQVRQQVLDYLLGTLDESEREAVRSRLMNDPCYRDALRLASEDLRRLRAAKREISVPPALAQRTCALIFDPIQRLKLAKLRRRGMTPVLAASGAPRRLSRVDLIVTGAILLIAGLLVLPAVNGSRFQSRVIACQDNLRHVGQALAEHSNRNQDMFPSIPQQGNLAADGIWAPVLQEEGLLLEPQKVLCPESWESRQDDFQIPSLADLRNAAGRELARIQQKMGGSYGYCLGYFDRGTLQPTRNLNRDYFAILADAPSDRPDHQSANHDGLGQNVLFEDMHIEFCSTTRPGIGRDDIYTNDDNAVAPGLHRDDSVLASSGTAPVVFVSLP